MNAVVGALRCLPCANTLRTVLKATPWERLDISCCTARLLTSLPALETIDVRTTGVQTM